MARAATKGGTSAGGGSGSGLASSPLANAGLVAGALAYGLWALVDRGRISWPPRELLTAGTTFAGCLAIIGPIVVGRRETSQAGLGDILWLAGGLLIWVFDLASLAARPVSRRFLDQPARLDHDGSRRPRRRPRRDPARVAVKSWSWTNVVGILLALFWIGSALAGFQPLLGNGFGSR